MRTLPGLLLATLSLSSGCASDPYHDPDLLAIDPSGTSTPVELPETYVMPGPGEPDPEHRPWGIRGGAHTFRLEEDREVEGKLLKQYSLVTGLEVRGRWLRDPQFAAAEFWRSDFAFVMRHGDAAFSRLDLTTDREEPTPYTRVSRKELEPRHAEGPDPFDPALLQIGFLDEAGRTLARRGRATGVDSLGGGGWVVHHVAMTGAAYDVLYDAKGAPLSPELPPLTRFGATFAARVEPGRELFWPIQPDGAVFRKPSALLGFEPVHRAPPNEDEWSCWVARWRTPQGERLAFIGDLRDEGGIMGSVAQADYVDMALGEYHDTQRETLVGVWIVRRAGAAEFEVLEPGRPRVERTFPDVAAARAFLPELNAMREAAQQERQAQRERDEAAAAAERARVSRARVMALLAEGKLVEARQLARESGDLDALRVAVIAALDAGQGSFVTREELELARCTSGGDQARIDHALADLHAAEPVVRAPELSDWDYFWHGPSSGPAPTEAERSARIRDSFKEFNERTSRAFEETQRRNEEAWLSGAQSWGAR